MSRHDKRAGRAPYTREERVSLNFAENMLKAKFGKFWDHEMAMPVLVLGIVDSVLPILKNPFFKKLDKSLRKNVRAGMEGQIKEWVAEKTNKKDTHALAGYAYLVGRMDFESAVDPEAFEILMAYYRHKRGDIAKKPPCWELDSNQNPSGKDLAIHIEELRKERGETPSSKTLEAIRERAIRLGLKLKGKRSKKK